MFSVITHIYNKKTKGPTLMDSSQPQENWKKKKVFFDNYSFSMYVPRVTRMWQQLEYRIDVCRVTRGAHIEHL